jgi:hypothetical protein
MSKIKSSFRKDAAATLTALEVNDLHEEELAAFDPLKGDQKGVITPDDIMTPRCITLLLRTTIIAAILQG